MTPFVTDIVAVSTALLDVIDAHLLRLVQLPRPDSRDARGWRLRDQNLATLRKRRAFTQKRSWVENILIPLVVR